MREHRTRRVRLVLVTLFMLVLTSAMSAMSVLAGTETLKTKGLSLALTTAALGMCWLAVNRDFAARG